MYIDLFINLFIHIAVHGDRENVRNRLGDVYGHPEAVSDPITVRSLKAFQRRQCTKEYCRSVCHHLPGVRTKENVRGVRNI